jgi:hypothetical protein
VPVKVRATTVNRTDCHIRGADPFGLAVLLRTPPTQAENSRQRWLETLTAVRWLDGDVDLGSAYFDDRDRVATEHRLVHRLEQLGYSVQLQRSAA